MVTPYGGWTSPKFVIGEIVSVTWPLDDQIITEIGAIVGMVWNCTQLGTGWFYAVARELPEGPTQSWFSEQDIIPFRRPAAAPRGEAWELCWSVASTLRSA